MTSRHGPLFYVVNDVVFTHRGRQSESRFDRDKRVVILSSDSGLKESPPARSYTRLVDQTHQALSLDLLFELGSKMTIARDNTRLGKIPAGYTYLGQFIAHDITRMRGRTLVPIRNERTPALDLESVFDYDTSETLLGCTDTNGILPVGCTTEGPAVHPNPYCEDLPRCSEKIAVIGDDRNDDVLPVAQTHVAVLKFVNRVMQVVGDRDKARKIAIEHFQSAVLHDYLDRILDPHVLTDIVTNGRALVAPGRMNEATRSQFKLSIEFALAYRFGHSMIRVSYPKWTRNNMATLTDFWSNTRNHGPAFGQFNGGLKWIWVNNWYRILDFADTSHAPAQIQDLDRFKAEILLAASIDTQIAHTLDQLPDRQVTTPEDEIERSLPRNLAQRTLMMHHSLEMTDAFTIGQALNQRLTAAGRPQMQLLTPERILRDDPALNAMGGGSNQIAERPPLWFYVLKEAELLQCGERLGPLGSRIIGETIHAAIEAAETSILHESHWQADPRLDPRNDKRYSFAHLIAFAGDPNPVHI